MTALRSAYLVLFALVPLVGLRDLWWSQLLFARPWSSAGGGDSDLGVFTLIFNSWPGGLVLGVCGLGVALLIDTLWPLLRGATLALALAFSLLLSALIVLLIPTLQWAAIWPLAGFNLVFVSWIYAVTLGSIDHNPMASYQSASGS